jgi:hypothetical protein
MLSSSRQLAPVGDLCEGVVPLKGLQLCHFLLHLFFSLCQFLSFLMFVNLGLLFGDALFLFDQILDRAGAAEEMALIAGGGFDETIIANCAHLKLFY